MLNFYDDFLWSAPKGEGKAFAKWVGWFLPALGWKLNAKCVWDPATTIDFLGFTVDSTRYEVRVSLDRLARTQKALKDALSGRSVDVNALERVTGQLVSMRPAVPFVGVWTRGLYQLIIQSKLDQIEATELTDEVKEEIEFWTKDLHGNPIVAPAATARWEIDAGETGAGAFDTGDHKQLSLPFDSSTMGKVQRTVNWRRCRWH